MRWIRVISVSGGKDSTACALLALEQYPLDELRFVFADNGNEHPATIEYIRDYLPTVLGKPVDVVRADFSRQIVRKREVVQVKWREEGVPESIIEDALAVLHPTGVPFLDLCLWKGRFPSRMAQFCTHETKVLPIAEYHARLMAEGFAVESWQGVRRDESAARRNAKPWEIQSLDYWIRRPIVDWTAQQTVDYVRSRGVELNPLYKQGMARVGCMPCINCNKGELWEIARRFPEHIERIAEWERIVSRASKRAAATFLPARRFVAGSQGMEAEQVGEKGSIIEAVKWAKTTRGGRQYDLLGELKSPACASAYGLCE